MHLCRTLRSFLIVWSLNLKPTRKSPSPATSWVPVIAVIMPLNERLCPLSSLHQMSSTMLLDMQCGRLYYCRQQRSICDSGPQKVLSLCVNRITKRHPMLYFCPSQGVEPHGFLISEFIVGSLLSIKWIQNVSGSLLISAPRQIFLSSVLGPLNIRSPKVTHPGLRNWSST